MSTGYGVVTSLTVTCPGYPDNVGLYNHDCLERFYYPDCYFQTLQTLASVTLELFAVIQLTIEYRHQPTYLGFLFCSRVKVAACAGHILPIAL